MNAERTVRWLLRLVCVSFAALLAATWPLWTPNHPWPQIPWLAAACGLPAWWDWLAAAVLGVGACLAFMPKQRLVRIAATTLALGLSAALVVDQHRLQPWAYEYLLIASLLAIAPRQVGVQCVRWLVISIYVYSAFSKFDTAYLATDGRELLKGFLGSIGLKPVAWENGGRALAVLLFPLGELLVGCALAFSRTRRIGLLLSLLMHGLLIWTLGPWGLNNEPAVLIWNAAFIVQNVLLFGRSALPASEQSPPAVTVLDSRPSDRFATLVAAAVIVAPALEPMGLWDHWPGWSVYSSRPAQVVLLIDESAVARLPASLQPHVGPPEPLSSWRPVSLDRWSLAELRAPVYPQLRFRLAAAAALGERLELGETVKVRVLSSPDRSTGRRESFEIDGTDAIRTAADRFRVNTGARGG